MAKSEDRFLVRASQDVSLDGEIWGAEVHMSDGSTKTYGIAGADGQAEAARKEAETAREAAETKRAENEAERTQAETARVTAEQERAAQQVKNNADQAANNAAAQGLQVVKLNEGQFDPDTLMPTVSGEVGKLYFVPIPSQAMSALAALVDVPAGDGQDNYLEWMSIDGKWERVGMSNATLVSLTTDEIDRIVAGEQVTSESVLDGTKLSYYMTKIKTAFAAFAHKHVTGDVTGLDAALGDKATKAELKTVQDSLDRISIVTNAVAQGSSTLKVRLSPKKNGRFMVLVAGNMNSCIPMLSFVAGTTASGDPEFTNIGSLPAKINGVSMSGNMLTVTLSTQNYGCVDVFGIGCSVSAA